MSLQRFICFICFMMAATIIAGCSDTISIVSQPGTPQNNVTQYFPLEVGQTASYRIDNANGLTQFVSYRVGATVEYQGNQAFRWIKQESTGGMDTSFFFTTKDGLFFIDNLSAQTEKMLAYPLNVGKSWSLYDGVTDGDDTTTIGTGNPDTTGGNAGASPSFFVEGGPTLSVAAVEGVQLEHGSYYSGTIKVRNVGTTGTTNYYWYAPGVGVVKYVLGATNQLPNGTETGEMISYSR